MIILKKVLVTGAGGSVGINVIKYLLSEGKYEITALDLRNKKSQKRLKRYRRRINLIYGDMNDSILMDALVKDHDYIIHLASFLPPIADIKHNISEMIDYRGTESIIKSMNMYNPNAYFIYASSTTIYGNVEKANKDTKPKLTPLDYYSKTKFKIEKLIEDKVKNYTIIRLPLVLTNPKNGAFMYNVKLNNQVEAITDNDAGYLFASAINHSRKLNRKVWNGTGGEMTTDTYRSILANVLKIYGLSFKYLLTLLFIDKNFYTHTYEDSDELESILEFRSDSLSSYYMRLKRQVKGRRIARLLAKPVAAYLTRKNRGRITNVLKKPFMIFKRKKNQ